MARVTVEDCLKHVPNRFALVHLGVLRARQLMKGSKPLVDDVGSKKEKATVVALREIGAGKVVLGEEKPAEPAAPPTAAAG